jgi:altronate hydrolase
MKNSKYLKIDEKDNVIISLVYLSKGEKLHFGEEVITVSEDIKIGHKIAIHDISSGDFVIKYGQVIGKAFKDISKGDLVHSHNLKTNLDEKNEYFYDPFENLHNMVSEIPKFYGYRRKNGKVGIRNEIWIINTVGCVNTTAERIAKICNDEFKSNNFDGVYSFSHPYGCSQLGEDLKNTKKVLSGLINNPNAGGILLLGLGCENIQVSHLIDEIPAVDRDRIKFFNSQEVKDEIDEGVRCCNELFEILANDKREEIPVSELIIGMKCGGSDGFSGISANPLLGRISDLMVSFGAKVILTEVPEMFGAEQQLLNRSKNKNIFDQIVRLIDDFKDYYVQHNQPIHENPSPGNKDGGITTLEEKSLGAIQKGGNSIITQILDYGEEVTENGLVLLKAAGNDGISSTAMVVSGATILLFTTGRGTPLGFPVPTVKISSNTRLSEMKPGWIDFNAGVVIDGDTSIDKLTESLLDFIIKMASGEIKTKNEINGYREIAIWKTGATL